MHSCNSYLRDFVEKVGIGIDTICNLCYNTFTKLKVK